MRRCCLGAAARHLARPFGISIVEEEEAEDEEEEEVVVDGC